MFKIKLGVILTLSLIVVSLIIVSAANINAQENAGRFLIKSQSLALKSLFGVQHNFDVGFTTDLTPGKVRVLELAGIEVEEVPVYELLRCNNDGVCGRGENSNNCPSDCPADGGGGEEESRNCFPTAQRDYNVIQVNGGNLGDGTGVNVAVLDTGTTPDHLDLDIKLCKDATKRGIKNGCKDSNGHGTLTSGIVGANGGADGLGLFGVAPSSNLWVVKVCSQFCFTDDIAKAIDHVSDKGVNIISMSFGGSSQSSLIKAAIDRHPDVLFVASSGNSGPNPNTIIYPAANPNVVAVAAHDSGKIVASFSSRGIDDGNDAIITKREVELSAGGVSVESTFNDGCYRKASGTSFSAPTVSGLAAKVWQGNDDDTRAFLISITQDITQANGGGAGIGYDIASGHGLPVAA